MKKLDLVTFFSVLLLMTSIVCAQRIGEPKIFEGNSERTEMCFAPNRTFNSIVIANLLPGDALPNNNQYRLELSDESGSFDSPIVLDTADGPNNGSSSEQDIEFTNIIIPEGIGGDTYRLRVTTTETSDVSVISDPIPVYYYRNDLRVRLNNVQDITLCNVANFTREIFVEIIETDNNDSAVDPNLFTYKWFDDVFPFGEEIPGETGPSIIVDQNDLDTNGYLGRYAQIDIGTCNSQFSLARSNNIRLTLIDVGEVSIVGGPTFNFCPGGFDVLTSSVTDSRNGYQWFKDDIAIEGAFNSTYTMPVDNFEGEYTLRVTYSEDCTITSPPVTVINDGSSITNPLVDNLIILPDQTLTLEVTTNAPIAPASSTFQWSRDGTPLTGNLPLTDLTVSIDVTNPGEYDITILADDSCDSMLDSTTGIYAPVGIGLTIGVSEDFDCQDETIRLELEEMIGFTLPGSGAPPEIALLVEQYDFFDFEWLIDGQPSGNTTTTLDIDVADTNSIYTLRADLRTGQFTNIISNELSVDPIPNDITIDASSTVLPDNGQVTLTVVQNASFTYEWYVVVDGEEQLIAGESGNTITVSEEGIYFVRISSGICIRDTPTVTIGNPPGVSEVVPNVIYGTGNANWTLPSDYTTADVEIVIYSANGKVDFQKSGGYNEEWPSESASEAKELLYYYIITKNSSVVKKGTITVMR